MKSEDAGSLHTGKTHNLPHHWKLSFKISWIRFFCKIVGNWNVWKTTLRNQSNPGNSTPKIYPNKTLIKNFFPSPNIGSDLSLCPQSIEQQSVAKIPFCFLCKRECTSIIHSWKWMRFLKVPIFQLRKRPDGGFVRQVEV